MNLSGRSFVAARVLILTLGAPLLLASHAPADDSTSVKVGGGLYGRWYFPTVHYFGVTHQASLDIEQSRITATNRCSYRGRKVVVRVASPARITANQLTVFEAKEDDKGNLPNCEVSLVRGTFDYRVRNDRLTLSDGTGETVEFTRKPR